MFKRSFSVFRFSVLTLFCALLMSGGYAQEIDLDKLTTSHGEVTAKFGDQDENVRQEQLFDFLLHIEPKENIQLLKASKRYETIAIQMVVESGYTFHIAHYSNETKVISCLNGPLGGVQEIYHNGVYQGGTENVQWYAGYFVHFYKRGRIISYPNKQILEIYSTGLTASDSR